MFSQCCKRLLQKNCTKLNELAAVADELVGLVTPGNAAGALTVFADDTAAITGGLVAGDQYITPDGVVHQVL